jgi:phosphoglycerate dehydrogenase-like enzyme
MKALLTDSIELDPADTPADLELRFCADEPAAVDAAIDESTEILVTYELPTNLERCAGLRWVQLLSAGVDQLIGHPLLVRDLLLTNAAGTNAVHIAELVVAQLLAHVKGLREFDRLQHARTWPTERVSLARPSLRGMCAVVVGYGGIGRETARLLAALGLRIIAVGSSAARNPYRGYAPFDGIGDPAAQLPERVVATANLREVLPEADVVVLSVPLLPTTRHLIDAAALACMKPSAILINVARGPVIDTAALLVALDQGQLAHVYLDVFDAEPLPVDSPLWAHPRVSITPHIAGTMPSHARRLSDLFLQNLARYRSGQPLLNQVDRRVLV